MGSFDDFVELSIEEKLNGIVENSKLELTLFIMNTYKWKRQR